MKDISLLRRITTLVIALMTPKMAMQITKKTTKLAFRAEMEGVERKEGTVATQNLDLIDIFYTDKTSTGYKVDSPSAKLRSQGGNPLQVSDFSGKNFGKVTLAKRLDLGRVALVLDSKSFAVQNIDGNLTKIFGDFQSNSFSDKNDKECVDMVVDQEIGAVYVLCLLASRSKKDFGNLTIYSIIGTDVVDVKDIELSFFVPSRTHLRLIKGTK